MENQTGIKLQFKEQRNVGRNVAPGRRFIHKQGLPCASQLIRHFLTKRGEPCTRETKRLLHEKGHPPGRAMQRFFRTLTLARPYGSTRSR